MQNTQMWAMYYCIMSRVSMMVYSIRSSTAQRSLLHFHATPSEGSVWVVNGIAMGVGKTELCMLAVIVASALYLYLGKDDEHNLPIHLSDDDIPVDPPDYNPAEEHGVRVCKSNGHAPNVFVLDLTYSVFPDEKIGDDILQDLFEVRTTRIRYLATGIYQLRTHVPVLQLHTLGR